MKKYLSFTAYPILFLSAGMISLFMCADSFREWYPMLVKSSVTPDDIWFAGSWLVAMLLAGIGAGINRTKEKHVTGFFPALILLTTAWHYLFLNCKNPILGLIIIILSVALLVYYFAVNARYNRLISILLLPLMLWLIWALYMNVFIVVFNT